MAEAVEAFNLVCGSGSSFLDFMGIMISWREVIAAAMLASTAILVLLYLAANIFRNARAIVFVKNELYQLIASAIIVVLVALWINSMCTFNLGYIFTDSQIKSFDSSLSADTSFYETAGTYINYVQNTFSRFMVYDMFGYTFVDTFASMLVIQKPMGQGFQALPFAGAGGAMKQMLTSGMIALSIAYVVNYAQGAILDYVLVAFPLYFLPLGLIFRSFAPTRRFGGTLIALCITFLVIYPLTLSTLYYVSVLGFEVTLVSMVKDSWMGSDFYQPLEEVYKNPGSPINTEQSAEFSTVIAEKASDATYSVISNPLTIFNVFDLIGAVVANIFGSIFTMLYLMFMPIVAFTAIVGFMFPAINTLILVYSMRSLGRILGDEVDITSLTRVI